MKIKSKLKKLLCEFWNGIIGLSPDQSIKSLSEEDLYLLYRDLGYQPLGMALFFLFMLWFLSISVKAGVFDTLFAISFGCVVFFFILKICWPKRKISIERNEEEVDCEFNQVGFKGFLTYNGKDYVVDDYIYEDKKLIELNLELECNEREGRLVRIFYSAVDPKFLKITEVKHIGGLRLSYKIVSWSLFAICFIATFTMIIGSLIILL